MIFKNYFYFKQLIMAFLFGMPFFGYFPQEKIKDPLKTLLTTKP